MAVMDEIGFGDLRILQGDEGFKYGTDAVLLAHMAAEFINREKSGRIMDLGTGNGIIPLILSHKTEVPCIYGLEVQEAQWKLAVENVRINDLTSRIRMVLGNVRNIEEIPELTDLKGLFHGVTCNPPYTEAGGGLINPESAKAVARHEILGSLEDFIKAANWLLEPGGSLYMIHRPYRLTDIICCCRTWNLEPKVMRLIAGKPGEEPNLVLIRCIKGAGRELKVYPQLTVRNSDGSFTDEVMRIYER